MIIIINKMANDFNLLLDDPTKNRHKEIQLEIGKEVVVAYVNGVRLRL
jgi:hypothetical protein